MSIIRAASFWIAVYHCQLLLNFILLMIEHLSMQILSDASCPNYEEHLSGSHHRISKLCGQLNLKDEAILR